MLIVVTPSTAGLKLNGCLVGVGDQSVSACCSQLLGLLERSTIA